MHHGLGFAGEGALFFRAEREMALYAPITGAHAAHSSCRSQVVTSYDMEVICRVAL